VKNLFFINRDNNLIEGKLGRMVTGGQVMKYISVYVFLLVFLLMSCDPAGNLRLFGGYECDVRVHSVYEYNGDIIDRIDIIEPGTGHLLDSRHDQYRHLIALSIETVDGTVLAEYPPEYLEQLRKLKIKQKYKYEYWVITEKGLFLDLDAVREHYRTTEEWLAYYRTDEAVQDLQAMLEGKMAPYVETGKRRRSE
jgi:hypothetical protein